MPGRLSSKTRQTATRREVESKPRMGKGTALAAAKDLRLARVLEEWLAEARIRYTHAGE